MRPPEPEALRCSFCHKAQGAVQKLMSSPSDYPRAYICDECIDVCVHIIEMERTPSPPQGGNAQETPHSLLAHPQISILLDAVERWIRQESLGDSGAEELAELRSTASRMLSVEGKN